MIIEVRHDHVTMSGPLSANLWLALKAPARLVIRRTGGTVIFDLSGLSAGTGEGALTFRDAVRTLRQEGARVAAAGVPEWLANQFRTLPEVCSGLLVFDSLTAARLSLSTEAPSLLMPMAGESPVLILGWNGSPPGAALRMAVRLFGEEKPPFQFVALLEVPRRLPLEAPLPEEEERAAELVDQARQVFKPAKLPLSVGVERTRDAGYGALEAVGRLAPRAVVVELPQEAPDHPVISALLAQATCEIVVVRAGQKS